MRKMITEKWLRLEGACWDGLAWWRANGDRNVFVTLRTLVKQERLDWFYWLAPRLGTKRSNVRVAVYIAKQVLPIFETAHPNDNRPRLALDTAVRWLRNPTQETRDAAWAAGDAAWAAAARAARAAGDARDAAWAARYAAGDAAWAARYAAGDAARAAWAAGDAAWAARGARGAARAAAWAARYAAGDAGDAAGDAAWAAMRLKIAKYWVRVLAEEGKK